MNEQNTRFTEEMVSLAKSYYDDSDQNTAPESSGSFAEYAMIFLHRIRTFLDATHKMILDRVEVIPPILQIIGLDPDDLLSLSTFNNLFDKIIMEVWCVLLRQSGQLHEPSPHAAVDTTNYERSPANKRYCDRTD